MRTKLLHLGSPSRGRSTEYEERLQRTSRPFKMSKGDYRVILGLYWGKGNKMETTILGLGFR